MPLSFPSHSSPPAGASSFPTRRSSDLPECHLANIVTDVVVKAPGGVNSNANVPAGTVLAAVGWRGGQKTFQIDRKSTRLNSSHLGTSYAVFCLRTKPAARRPRACRPRH